MRNAIRSFLLVLSLIFGLAFVFTSTPAAAQYSHNRGGNCETPLIRWKGAHQPCDGYERGRGHANHGQRGHSGQHRGGGHAQGRSQTYVVPGPSYEVYRGTVAVPVGTLLVPRGGGPSIFIPR